MSSEFWLEESESAGSEKHDLDWTPSAGPGFEELEKRMRVSFTKSSTMPEDAFQSWKTTVFRTAGRCAGPTHSDVSSASQLVVGRVQAGKTSSFTGLIRLLADNHYRIFVVIAGTSTNLRDQTFDRLTQDLSDSDDIEIIRTGKGFDPRLEANRLIKRMRGWSQPKQDDTFLQVVERKVVYVVLKSTKAHLESVLETFVTLKDTAEGARLLSQTPTVIIDDEADQASPNGRAAADDRKEMTAVYKCLRNLRQQLVFHSFVGYTATPYANVLMDVASEIRPEYVTMLEPGADYTGTVDLFLTDVPFAKVIEDFEDASVLPESLKLAFAVLICQSILFHCSDEEVRDSYFLEPFRSSRPSKTVTMLIHADRLVRVSSSIAALLRDLRDIWASIFSSSAGLGNRVDVAEEHIWQTYFEPALTDLEAETEAPLPRTKFRRALGSLIGEIGILEIVGSGDDFPSDLGSDGKPTWKSRPAWVLVGGQLLDRGQTLPNLVNSYMPRSPGGGAKTGEIGGQFDTLQQRGRFYGHRRTYRTIIRGWFDTRTLDTYREIALSEQQHFDVLGEIDLQGLKLSQTPIRLESGNSSKLKLVRKNVLGRSVQEVKSSAWLARQLWYRQDSNSNRLELLAQLIDDKEFVPYARKNPKQRSQFNLRAFVSIEEVQQLLASWNFDESDKAKFEIAAHYLSGLRRTESLEEVELVLMSRNPMIKNDPFSHDEFRTSDAEILEPNSSSPLLRIKQLPSSNDLNYVNEFLPTMQVHFLDVIGVRGEPRKLKDQIGLAVAIPSARPSIYRGPLA